MRSPSSPFRAQRLFGLWLAVCLALALATPALAKKRKKAHPRRVKAAVGSLPAATGRHELPCHSPTACAPSSPAREQAPSATAQSAEGVSLDAAGNSDASDSSTPFPMPPELVDATRFWFRLFTEYASYQLVIHDRDNLGVIWDVVALPKDNQGRVIEGAARRVEAAIQKEIAQRLARLEHAVVALDPNDARALDPEDTQLLSQLASSQHALLRGASERVRIQRGVADAFAAGITRCKPWFKQMRGVLRAEKVPEHILALAFVESMCNPAARSAVGAAGMWQLMPNTARGLGLKVAKRGKDERAAVLPATRAAARMLRHNYKILGTWPLAITGYNHGPNGVKRAVLEVGSTDLMVLIERYSKRSFGFASKNFYAEFLAALAALRLRTQVFDDLPSDGLAGRLRAPTATAAD